MSVTRARLRTAAPYAAVGVVLVALLVWWIYGRRTAAVDVDEGVYFAQALRAAHDTGHGFVSDLTHLYFYEPSSNAPLLSLVSIPFLLVLGRSVEAGLLAQIPFLLLLAGATYALGRRLADPRWAVVATAAAVLNPFTIDYAASYHFALPSAALFTAALAALVCSERFDRLAWSLGWGALVGLTLLARTMMLGLVPGLVLAGVVAVVVHPDRRRVGHLLAGLGVALVIAGPWYVANWSVVVDYLTGYGYGAESASFGDELSPFGLAYWFRVPSSVLRLLFLPITALLVGGLVVAAVRAGRGARSAGVRPWLERSASRGHLLLAVAVLFGYLALTSSQNNGTGFELPLIPAVCVLAAAGYARLRTERVGQVILVAFAVSLVGVVVAKSTLLPPFTTQAAKGSWVDGRSRSERYVEDAGYDGGTDVTPVAQDVVAWMRAGDPDRLVVAYAPGDPLLNYGLLESVSQRDHHQDLLLLNTVDPDQLDDGDANFLVTVGGVDPDDALSIAGDVDAIEQAAEAAGFTLEQTFPMPEGREVRVWQRG